MTLTAAPTPAALAALTPLTAAALVALAVAIAPAAPAAAASSPIAAPATLEYGSPRAADRAAAGTISGRVELEEPPRRRAPNRYPGRGGPPARRIQPVPAVVYLRGPGPASRPPATVMAQRDTAFVPAVLVVPVGTTVDFPNHDPFFHNVFSYSSPARFDLGRYPTGESKGVTFDEAGVVKVYCEVHEFMRGAVVVTRSGRHAVVAEDGSFTLPDVPAGEWTLVAWHPDLGEAEREVSVPDDGVVEVSLSLGAGSPP